MFWKAETEGFSTIPSILYMWILSIQDKDLLTLLVLISDFAENAKCLKLPRFYRLLIFQCATQICGHFLFCTQCQFLNFRFLVLKICTHSFIFIIFIMFIADDHVQSWHGLERNFRIKLNLLSEILLIVWNLEHQELK